MKKVRLLCLFTMLLLLTACSTNIQDATFNSETEYKVEQSEELTREEKELFESAVVFANDNNISLEGQTVSEIIADEEIRLEELRKKEVEEREHKRLEREEKRLQREREKAEAEKELNNSVLVHLNDKFVIPKDVDNWLFSDIIVNEFIFENTTDKDIAGFKGVTVYKDMFGDFIIAFDLSFDEGISANDSVYWSGEIEVNEYMDDHIKLRNIEYENIQFEFEVDTIIFSDGAKISKH